MPELRPVVRGARRGSWCYLLMILLVSTMLVPTAAARADDSVACAPQGKDQIADVTERLRNFADAGVDGHVWALTDVVIRIRVWKVGTNHFCVRRDFHGTFETFAGVSPNLTGTVSAGVTGAVDGYDWAVFTGEWAPRVAVSGFVGDFDLGCNQAGECAIRRGVGYLFFANGFQSVQGREFSFVYDGGERGIWRQSDEASVGDITG